MTDSQAMWTAVLIVVFVIIAAWVANAEDAVGP